METPALLAFEEDIHNRSWLDWLEAHTSFLKPLHRYEGTMTLYADKIGFIGLDRKTGKDVVFDFYKYQIDQLYLGFDDTFNMFETRSLGLTWVPLRLRLTISGNEKYLYIITNYYLGLKTDNKEWFVLLKNWLQ